MSIRRSSVVCGVTVLVVVGLAGCGSSGASSSSSSSSASSSASAGTGGGESAKSAPQVLKEAKSALFNAASVHVIGTMTSNGQQEKLDLRFQGSSTSGTVTMGGLDLNIIKIGDTAYVKAPAQYWTKTAGPKAAGLADKWIKAPSTSTNVSSLTLQGLAASLNSTDSPMQPGVKQSTVDGKKAVVVTQKDGSTLSVADATPPVPLQIVNTAAATKGQLDFTEYGAKQNIAAPPGAVTAEQAVQGQKTPA